MTTTNTWMRCESCGRPVVKDNASTFLYVWHVDADQKVAVRDGRVLCQPGARGACDVLTGRQSTGEMSLSLRDVANDPGHLDRYEGLDLDKVEQITAHMNRLAQQKEGTSGCSYVIAAVFIVFAFLAVVNSVTEGQKDSQPEPEEDPICGASPTIAAFSNGLIAVDIYVKKDAYDRKSTKSKQCSAYYDGW